MVSGKAGTSYSDFSVHQVSYKTNHTKTLLQKERTQEGFLFTKEKEGGECDILYHYSRGCVCLQPARYISKSIRFCSYCF